MDQGPGRDGLSAAIEATLRRSEGLIRAAVFRAGLEGGELDGVLQDLRIRLWRAFDRPGENRTTLPASYVYKATVSSVVDFLRRRRAERRLQTVSIESVEGTLTADSGDISRVEPLVEALDCALARLSPDRRVAVRLHLKGKDRDAIAEFTGWSEARTRNLLYRGLTDLREALRKEAHE
jgi:RNA polymerase sigma-70 factor (ECF subfamily)